MGELLTVEEAAAVWHTSPAALRAMIRAGQLPAGKIGRRWLIDPADLARAFEAARAANMRRHKKIHTNTP